MEQSEELEQTIEPEPTPRRSELANSGREEANRPLWFAVAAATIAAIALFAIFSSTGESNSAPSNGPAEQTEADPESTESGDTATTTDAPTARFSDLVFLTEDGTQASLDLFAGEPMVVNFFASWCGPCRAELPDFQEVHLANGDAVKFLGVNLDLDEGTWRAFVEETQITYETVYQPGSELFNELEAVGMPSTAFISADGEVMLVYTGLLNQGLLQDLIDEHLIQ